MPMIFKTWNKISEETNVIDLNGNGVSSNSSFEDELPSIEDDSDVYDDAELMDKMIDLILDLDPDSLTDEQLYLLNDILDIIDSYDTEFSEENNEIKEALAPKRKKIDRAARRERAKKYRRNKARIKQKARLYRKTAKGKRYAKKAKKMGKLGKTATGKRKTKLIK